MDGLPPILETCRALLNEQTPLAADCGQLCRGACCHSLPGEETGMLLFPGEEAAYQDKPGWQVKPCADGLLVICPGVCDRTERPLSCRLFPLLPVVRPDGVKVTVDARSKAVCPLARSSCSGMQPNFVQAVRTCGQLLCEDEEQRAFLMHLTALHDEWKALQSTFSGRDAHV